MSYTASADSKLCLAKVIKNPIIGKETPFPILIDSLSQ